MGIFDWFKKKKDDSAPVQLTPEEELEIELSRANSQQNVLNEESRMTLEEATQVALEITSQFEGEGFAQVTGNFDDQLLSCGALQWAWKQGTQQKLIKKCELLYPGLIQSLMPVCGKRYLQFASLPVSQSDATLAVWSKGEKVFEPYYSELKRLWGSPEMVSIQIYFASEIAKRASHLAMDWNRASTGKSNYECTLQEFCFFFDVIVNNGSMRELDYHDVQERIDQNGREKVLNEVLNWCATRTRAYAHFQDCAKNAEVWKLAVQSASENEVNLFILGWLRALKSIHLYQAVVMNRRGILALGIGYANGDRRDLNSKYADHWPGAIVN